MTDLRSPTFPNSFWVGHAGSELHRLEGSSLWDQEEFLGQQWVRTCRAVPACVVGWLWSCQRVQKDGLEQRQHHSVFSSGEFGQGRYISHEETQWGYLPCWACFGAVWSDSKGRAWRGQHLSGSLARRCFEGGVPWGVPVSPAPRAVFSEHWFLCQLLWARPLPGSGVSSGEWAGSMLSCATLT